MAREGRYAPDVFDETLDQAYQQRFGGDAPRGYDALSIFLRHRSVRKYSEAPIAPELRDTLVAAAQSSATSSNLHLWTMIAVDDPQRRERIAQLCAGQEQVRTAGAFFAFFADHYRLRVAAERAGEDPSNLDYAEFFTMAVVDAALAAERMVCAAESAGLGICYIGALRNDPEGVKEFFGLPEGVFGVFGLCLGWPAADSAADIKPRLKPAQVCFQETYDLGVSTDEYDDRMKDFYESQQMKGEVTWSMRSGRRLQLKQMSGREALLPWLTRHGFLRR